jgi:hypothetical protein
MVTDYDKFVGWAEAALNDAQLADTDAGMRYGLMAAQTYATLAVAAATMAVAEGR